MQFEICTEKHKSVDEKINSLNRKFDIHDDRLDKLEQDGRELKNEIKNLCKNLKSLTDIMKWFLTVMGGSLIGFFFYVIQTELFKK